MTAADLAARRRIAVLGTWDTKAEALTFLSGCIAGRGHEPVLVDLGITEGRDFPGGLTREDVARAAGTSLPELAGQPRQEAMPVVSRGAGRLLGDLVAGGRLHGVIGIGGGSGTVLAAAAMRQLPVGFPKVMMSTVAAGRLSAAYAGESDLVLMPTVTDVAGLNHIILPVLANGAAAICGMAEGVSYTALAVKRSVAMTMYGVTTTGGDIARAHLEAAGFEVIVFHATGLGGRTMERLIADGHFDGVLDWTTTEVTDEVVGDANGSAGPHRMEAAGRAGIPQVIVPGGVDIATCWPIREKWANRKWHMHTPLAGLMRADTAESREVGRWIAAKLNQAAGPVEVIIPELGFSAYDAPGGVFEDPEADAAFTDGLTGLLSPGIRVTRIRAHINDERFARTAAQALVEAMSRTAGTRTGISTKENR
jgi:uncharacterized protein (UPF0261 family)